MARYMTVSSLHTGMAMLLGGAIMWFGGYSLGPVVVPWIAEHAPHVVITFEKPASTIKAPTAFLIEEPSTLLVAPAMDAEAAFGCETPSGACEEMDFDYLDETFEAIKVPPPDYVYTWGPGYGSA